MTGKQSFGEIPHGVSWQAIEVKKKTKKPWRQVFKFIYSARSRRKLPGILTRIPRVEKHVDFRFDPVLFDSGRALLGRV